MYSCYASIQYEWETEQINKHNVWSEQADGILLEEEDTRLKEDERKKREREPLAKCVH